MNTRVCIDVECPHAGRPQPEENFPWRSKANGIRRHRCRPCQNLYVKASRNGELKGETKVCTGCGEEKETHRFAWKYKQMGVRNARCRECVRDFQNPEVAAAHIRAELDQGWNVLKAYEVLKQPVMGRAA